MNKIKLYNEETDRQKWLFAALLHEIILKQYSDAKIVGPFSDEFKDEFRFNQEGTEHLALIGNDEIIYARSYLAISTSPEAGINRRLNRIIKIPNKIGKFRLKRVIFSLAVECPRSNLEKVNEVVNILGNRGIQFELWEAKDVRRQVLAKFGINCPAFEKSHLTQLASTIPLAHTSLNILEGREVNVINDVENYGEIEPLGTLFISHASEDKNFVDKLVSELDPLAKKVWYDKREIFVGDSIIEKINIALREASAVIVVLSENSLSKPWFLRELNSTLSRQLRPERMSILPVLIEKCDIPPLLTDIKYADFTDSFETGLNQLIAGLQRSN